MRCFSFSSESCCLGPFGLTGLAPYLRNRTILKSSPARSPDATETAGMSTSQSLPPSSFGEVDADQTTPRQTIKQRRRRNSDRIRSPSDSSSTSSDDDRPLGNLRSIPPRASFERQISAPPASKSFPQSMNSAAPILRPSMPRRPKTLSDPHMDSPLAARMASRNAAGPPSAFGNFGSFARPSPASRRRRGSSSQYGSDAEIDEESYRPIRRSMSSKSIALKSGSEPWPKDDLQQVTSPTSPDGIDDSPFFHREKSPESVAGSEHAAVEVTMEDDGAGDVVEMTEDEIEETEDRLGDGLLGNAAMNPRLSRLSVSTKHLGLCKLTFHKTGSSLSLRTSHDKLQALQKQNTELARKLKESERQLSLLG